MESMQKLHKITKNEFFSFCQINCIAFSKDCEKNFASIFFFKSEVNKIKIDRSTIHSFIEIITRKEQF